MEYKTSNFLKAFLSRLAAVCLAIVCLAASPWGFAPLAQAADLTVYSYRQPFLVEPLLEAFRQETGIKVEVLYAKKGLIERLKLEGKNSPADLLLSNNTLRLIEAKEEKLTAPVTDPDVLSLIPTGLMDKDRNWVGLTRRGRVIYANEHTVPPGSVTDYLDLGSHRNDYTVCLRPWRHSYNVSLVAYLLSSIGEKRTAEWIEAVQARLGRKPQGNDRAQIKAVNSGECDLAIANSYYFGVMKADPKQVAHTLEVYSIFPTLDKHYGTFGFVSGISLLKNSDNPVAAQKLIAFMAGDTAQKIYASSNHEYPASKVFQGMISEEKKLDDRPLADTLKFRKKALALINRLVKE